jgi:hypothetical protein
VLQRRGELLQRVPRGQQQQAPRPQLVGRDEPVQLAQHGPDRPAAAALQVPPDDVLRQGVALLRPGFPRELHHQLGPPARPDRVGVVGAVHQVALMQAPDVAAEHPLGLPPGDHQPQGTEAGQVV